MGTYHITGEKELTYIHIPRTGMGIKRITSHWFQPNFNTYYTEDWMLNHPSLRMVREKIPTGKTFSVIRNPWMRLWKFYRKIAREGYWLDWNNSTDLKPFNEWLVDYANPTWDFTFPRWFDRWTQMYEFIEYRDLNGKFYTVDFLLRAESLEQDFVEIQDYLGCHVPLPDLSMHIENTDYRQYYNDKGIEAVYKVHERDIIKYNYTF
jgi:hypothetical protein